MGQISKYVDQLMLIEFDSDPNWISQQVDIVIVCGRCHCMAAARFNTMRYDSYNFYVSTNILDLDLIKNTLLIYKERNFK